MIFTQTHPDDNNGMFQIFERINTSGRTLVAQEIRNCIYQGELNRLLFKLNKVDTWRMLFGREEHYRMLDIEFILRFLALSETNFLKYTKTAIQLKKFLNDFMYENEKMSQDKINLFEERFVQTINKVYSFFQEEAFFNISINSGITKSIKKFNPTIFDSIMISSYIAISKNPSITTDNTKRIELLKNEEYQEAISVRTTNTESINKRISLALNILYGLKYE